MVPKVFRSNPTIEWKFQVFSQRFGARYGVSGPFFYKQFLVNGAVVPGLHPPKRITEKMYRLALRRHEGANDGPTV